MEFVEPEIDEKEKKSKNTMFMLVVAIVVLFIISIGLIATISYLKAKQFNFTVDGVRIKNNAIPEDLFYFEGDKAYVSLKDIAPFIGYKYYNGGYKQYTEDSNKCYLECSDEIATFEKSSNKIYKSPTDEVDYSYFTITEPIIKHNNKLYIEAVDLGLACNIKITASQVENMAEIYTLPYLVKYYTRAYTNSALSTSFNNQKALLYGLMVVQNADNTDKDVIKDTIRYGVHDLKNQEIVGMKYTNIEFIEGSQEFIVTTEEKKVGLITADGDTKVKPQFDALKQIDKDLNLYLATDNNKKGVIEKNGKTLIYLEYDEIGVDTSLFPTNDIKNKYILYNKVIPVKQNGKWGFFDVKGKQVLPVEYVKIGCIPRSSEDVSMNSVLVIPDIQGIVVGKEYTIGDGQKTIYYGIYNASGKELIPEALDSVYSITVSGQEQYSMTNVGNTYDVIDYIREYVLPNQTVESYSQDDENEVNNNTNEVADSNTTVDDQATTSNTSTQQTTNSSTQQSTQQTTQQTTDSTTQQTTDTSAQTTV